ncbi:DUF2627 domain-containing protein [Escherichia coli]
MSKLESLPAEPYIGASCSNVSVLSMLCLRAKKTI